MGHPSTLYLPGGIYKGHNPIESLKVTQGLTACCFSSWSRAGHTTPLGSLLNVPLVDDTTDQAVNQESGEYSLPSEEEDRGVCIGEALPPVSKKLAERIW